MSEMIANIPNQSSTKLAEMVVCYRYLGLYKEMSLLAMEELGKRRGNGDGFDYEGYIAAKLEELPKMDAEKPGIGNVVSVLNKYLKKDVNR